MEGAASYCPNSNTLEVRVTLDRRELIFQKADLNARIRDELAKHLADAIWRHLSPAVDKVLDGLNAEGCDPQV